MSLTITPGQQPNPAADPFDQLPDKVICKILYASDNPATAQVCTRFANIEFTLKPATYPSKDKDTQTKRIKRRDIIAEIANILNPENIKSNFKAPLQVYLAARKVRVAEEGPKPPQRGIGEYCRKAHEPLVIIRVPTELLRAEDALC